MLDRGSLAGPANPREAPVGGFRNLQAVLEWNRLTHAAVYEELRAGRLPALLAVSLLESLFGKSTLVRRQLARPPLDVVGGSSLPRRSRKA